MRPNAKENAFTLIEMVAATALAGILMLAVMTVIGGSAQTRKAYIAESQRSAPWRDRLVETIQTDLLHLDAFSGTPSGKALLHELETARIEWKPA